MDMKSKEEKVDRLKVKAMLRDKYTIVASCRDEKIPNGYETFGDVSVDVSNKVDADENIVTSWGTKRSLRNAKVKRRENNEGK